MVALIIISMLILVFFIIKQYWNVIVSKSITYKVNLSKNRAFTDEEITFMTQVTNKKIIIIPWIKVIIKVPNKFNFKNSKVEIFNQESYLLKIITSLLWFEKIRRSDSFSCSKRGSYKIDPAIIEIGNFIEGEKIHFSAPFNEELVIYPKIKNLIDLIYFPKPFQGDVSVKRWIINDPTQVIGVKKYTNEDSFNTIDWKISAKKGELYVKQYDFTAEPSIMTYLDIQTNPINWMGNDYELIEKGIDIIASLMNKALIERIPIGYTSNTVYDNENGDIFLYPSRSSKQRDRILEALAKTSYRRTYNITVLINDTITRLDKSCTIILLLSYMTTELSNNLNRYTEIGYKIKIILLNNDCNTISINKKIQLIYLRKEWEAKEYAN